VIRRRTGEESGAVFVTVFAGNRLDKRLVESARLLTIRGGDAANAVAVAVKTTEGVDLVVSQRSKKWKGRCGCSPNATDAASKLVLPGGGNCQ
jgi:hypothetical protein